MEPEKLDLDTIENIEKASIRMVTQAIYDFRSEAVKIFAEETDLQADIGEDITREALDLMGMSKIAVRLFGKIDYKRARYVFHPDYAVRQALFVDSKAEKISGQGTATIQMSQTSMMVKQIKSGQPISEQGKMPCVLSTPKGKCLVTTIFVKYNYEELQNRKARLDSITIACLPNGMLQERYNPTHKDGIWLVGRHAPSRGEEFRVRISFKKLQSKQRWRVQNIVLYPHESFDWSD